MYDYNGIFECEGEYLNGERNGKGKEYNDNGQLVFEGEYLNGERWNGKEYDNGTLKFEGKYLNTNGYSCDDKLEKIEYKFINNNFEKLIKYI